MRPFGFGKGPLRKKVDGTKPASLLRTLRMANGLKISRSISQQSRDRSDLIERDFYPLKPGDIVAEEFLDGIDELTLF